MNEKVFRVNEICTEVRGSAGLLTLERPQALNALSLDMIRALTEVSHG